MRKRIQLVMVMAIVVSLVSAASAFAGWGWSDYCPMGSGGHWGSRDRGGYGSGYGNYGGLSNEEVAQIEREQAVFISETESLRQSLYERNLAMRSELAKANPDPDKVNSINREMGDLESRLSQKSIDFELKMRKTAPSYRGGYMGGDMGRGQMMMGPGQYGGGYCAW